MPSNERFDVAISNLSVRYPDRDRNALDEFSETLAEGEVVAIAGPSGCGKTTLCRTLAGFVPSMIPAIVSGDVRLGGESLRNVAPEALATRVGLVQQDPDAQICTLSAWQEVAFGPENLCLPVAEVRARVERCLGELGIAHLRDRVTTSLSGGEKQRLAIASILAMEPQVLLFDEPTANLDPRGIQALFVTLSDLVRGKGRTLVVIEHRIDALLALGPRLVLLDRGKLVERYPARERIDYAEVGLRGAWSLPPAEAAAGSLRIVVDRLSFGYVEPLWRDLSFSLREGEVLAVIGPNGGGKTSLLRLLAGLATPREGTIERAAGTRVGFVFQHPHHQIFERTVRQEIELGNPRGAGGGDAELRDARLAGLEDAAPLSLSLGEQRRLTMATTLARQPNLLLLDEPFIGQDRRNVLWMISRLREVVAAGGTAVLVTHDIPLAAALADRVLYLDRGVQLLGRPDEVFGRLRDLGETAFTPEAWL
ncbi:MAG: ATP-binding cassette domain-containing protein [Candidatus Bipolaricaulota bacterium]|nr:ATP-binding cassette domain-containing protein [Candidatus Bipolaricaulota bacterium]